MAAQNKNRPSNYVILTLQAIADSETQFGPSGKAWSHVRAFLSQGKNEDDSYKPSIFFEVKAFTKKDAKADMSPVVKALGAVTDRSRFPLPSLLSLLHHPSSIIHHPTLQTRIGLSLAAAAVECRPARNKNQLF